MTSHADPNESPNRTKPRLTPAVALELSTQAKGLVQAISSTLLFAQDEDEFFQAAISSKLRKLLALVDNIYQVNGDKCLASSRKVLDLTEKLQALAPLFQSDIEAALFNDPASDDPLEVALCYPGCKAIRSYRIAHILFRANIPLLPRLITEIAHEETGIDIHPGATIGSHFFIDHGTGVVIGETAVIGQSVTLYHGVTLGARSFRRDQDGKVMRGVPRHPVIGDHVTIYSGASILGRIEVGSGSILGNDICLTKSVPQNSKILLNVGFSNRFIDGGGI